ncbi:unnamed protein product [Paramecium octaurelia]|uniref:Uncharacterized protein n=1 Tax=Paramecium octaurelia TaxID=43137 RepID=A0A8S1WKI6_PAROT|nr:unnamed protein product [Paramecium octaurelia]
MSELENIKLNCDSKGIKKKILQDKFRKKVQFLQLVLCQNQTIKTAAAQSQIKFATAKVVLKKFRHYGFLKNSDKDYEKQIDLLRQIACIKSEIKQEKIQKRDQEFQVLSQKIRTIQPQSVNKVVGGEMNIQSQLRIFQEELQNLQITQLQLVKSVLLEQIKLMENHAIFMNRNSNPFIFQY